jgi:hypothetical protein
MNTKFGERTNEIQVLKLKNTQEYNGESNWVSQ